MTSDNKNAFQSHGQIVSQDIVRSTNSGLSKGRAVGGRFFVSALDETPLSSSPALDGAIQWVTNAVMHGTVKR